MTRQEILEALENGNYSVNHEEDCCCDFRWDIECGTLVDNASGMECWEGSILYIGNTAIAESIRFDETRPLVSEISLADIDNIDPEILYDMRLSDVVNRGESPNNDQHEKRRRDELVEFLMKCRYLLEEDEGRGFANEYTSILREPEEGEEVTTTREEAEKWADSFLYIGDGATEAFNGFRFISRGEN